MGAFGESLKRERELRGVSLDEISSATRISTRFLRAIENEEWDQLPGGVFNRGFVRAMARYLGLDEENTVAEYTLAVGDRQSVPVWTGSPPAVTPEQPWLAWIIAVVVLLALGAGGWLGAQKLLAWRAAQRAHSDPTSAVTPSAEAASAESAPRGAPLLPIPPAPDLLELRIEAGRNTRVTVDADGNRVFEGTMNAGEARTFSAKDRFEVYARDGGTLRLEMNGKTLAPIGPPGRAGKVTLTRAALQGAAGGGN